MNKLNYPCDKTPNGLCVDCTNDGPLCDFDKCKYMSLHQNNQNNRKKNDILRQQVTKAKSQYKINYRNNK